MENSVCDISIACKFYINGANRLAPSIAEAYRKKYCHNCKDACAIYMIAKHAGLDYIPVSFFPNEYDKVLDIIKNHH